MVEAIQADGVQLGDSTKLVGDLLKIQGLFFETSEYKNGPKAGKVNLEQFYKGKDSLFQSTLANTFSVFSNRSEWILQFHSLGRLQHEV